MNADAALIPYNHPTDRVEYLGIPVESTLEDITNAHK